MPLGKLSNKNRCQWNSYAEVIAPAFWSNARGAKWVARDASTTALYSAAFLSGLNKIL